MTPEKLLKEISIQNTEPADLKKNDLFLIIQCGSFEKFRVIKVLATGVYAQWAKAMKSDADFYTFNELARRGYVYYGRLPFYKRIFWL